MADSKPGRKRKREPGRPMTHEYPEKIDANPEEIADVVMRAKSKKVWRFEQETGRSRRRGSTS